jgi:S-adenosylmethionine:tRNA ribosyltransferase-isomerase
MEHFPELSPADFHYELPPSRIAEHPLAQRDSSKLLVYRQGQTEHKIFHELPEALPPKSLLVFNNTKVLPARIYFQKPSGGQIEVFLLHPALPTNRVEEAMLVKGFAVWECAIGNLKRWKTGQVLTRDLVLGNTTIRLTAQLHDREAQWVAFSWEPASHSFADVMQLAGEMPLPPYIKRKAEASDQDQYQTVYSKKKGAVAAPTAGLHFTKELLNRLRNDGHHTDEVTLHISAATFRPVKVENIAEHPMHHEQLIINRDNVVSLLESNFVVSVGTTSLRTLESLYWFGVKIKNQGMDIPLFLEKNIGFSELGQVSRKEALEAVLAYMDYHQKKELGGGTEIFIVPGYTFKMTDALITNFHLPSSTLIFLIAACIGNNWRKVYQDALDNQYRFLSYGDSSLLFIDP